LLQGANLQNWPFGEIRKPHVVSTLYHRNNPPLDQRTIHSFRQVNLDVQGKFLLLTEDCVLDFLQLRFSAASAGIDGPFCEVSAS
jgi:hypothetical protein